MKITLLLVALLGLTLALKIQAPTEDPLWNRISREDPSEIHSVTFAIKQKATEADCGSILDIISNPKSVGYGDYLTLGEIADTFTNRDSVAAVKDWLEENKISFQSNIAGDLIVATADVATFERILQAEFYIYESIIGDKVIRRTDTYTIPQQIENHVEFIGNTIRFPPVTSKFFSYAPRQGGYVTPSLISSFYNIPSNTVKNSGATQAIFEAGSYFNPSDLTQFQQEQSLPSQSTTIAFGTNNASQCEINPDACGEASLDVQYITGVAQQASTSWYFMNPYSIDPFLDLVVLISNKTEVPLVYSISYGSLATEDDKLDMGRFNLEVCKLGLRGITVVVASGDDGVANYGARNNASACGFTPSYPATSPYVLAVGATQGPESGLPEQACMSNNGGIITSGGGFSIYFPQPSYQSTAVATYLSTAPNLPPQSLFNAQGRGYPDVSALGFNYDIVLDGQDMGVAGTSASTPVFAAMITLINDARISAGKPSVGFVNPALYQLAASTPSVFHDITVGENNCCAGYPAPTVCCTYGFNATVGWDPITGLGSPNFGLLLKAFLKM